jgi:hypothetical protein
MNDVKYIVAANTRALRVEISTKRITGAPKRVLAAGRHLIGMREDS